MRRTRAARGFAACLLALALATLPIGCQGHRWEGSDDKLAEYAEEHGHAPREPYINTDQGDLLHFLFLGTGALAGFVAGYTFRGLFPPRGRRRADAKPNKVA